MQSLSKDYTERGWYDANVHGGVHNRAAYSPSPSIEQVNVFFFSFYPTSMVSFKQIKKNPVTLLNSSRNSIVTIFPNFKILAA